MSVCLVSSSRLWRLPMLLSWQDHQPFLLGVFVADGLDAASFVHIDLTPFPEIYCLGGIQYHMLICDEFSTHLHSFAMKTKSNSDIIIALTSLVSYFTQYGYDTKVIHSDHESVLISATSFINQQVFNITPLLRINTSKNWKDMCRQSMHDLDQCYRVLNINFRINYMECYLYRY